MFKKIGVAVLMIILGLSVLSVYAGTDKGNVPPSYIDVPPLPDAETVVLKVEGSFLCSQAPDLGSWLKGRIIVSAKHDGRAWAESIWKEGGRIQIPKGPWTFIQISAWKKNPPGSDKSSQTIWEWKWGTSLVWTTE